MSRGTKHKPSRAAAGRAGAVARWGDRRTPSRQIRIDAAAAEMLAQIAERDRRDVASRGVIAAATNYLTGARDEQLLHSHMH